MVTNDNNLNQVNTDCVVSSKYNDSNLVDAARARSSNSLVSNNNSKQHQVACAGAFNSVTGKKKNDVSLVQSYVVIYSKMLNSSGVCIIPFQQLCQWGAQALGF